MVAFTASGLLTGMEALSIFLPWIGHSSQYWNPWGIPVLVLSAAIVFTYLALMVAFRFGLQDTSLRARVYRGLLVFSPLWILPILSAVLFGLHRIMQKFTS